MSRPIIRIDPACDDHRRPIRCQTSATVRVAAQFAYSGGKIPSALQPSRHISTTLRGMRACVDLLPSANRRATVSSVVLKSKF